MSLADSVITYKIIKILTTPFTQTDAYKLGVIDAHGKKIKNPTTPAEQESYNVLNRLVFRLKMVLNLVPGMNQHFLSYAAAIALIKECYYNDEEPANLEELFTESFSDKYTEIQALGFALFEDEGGAGVASAASTSMVPANTVANIKNTITGVGKKSRIRYFRRSKINQGQL